MLITKFAGLLLVSALSINDLQSQSDPSAQTSIGDGSASASASAKEESAEPNTTRSGEQPKRILGIIPNYRAVSADAQVPRLSAKTKFGLATRDSFDYTSFIFAGLIAGVGQLQGSTPDFGHGAAGYGQYYWHSFADVINGNYLTEAIVPSLTHEDPRYYTLGHGTFLHRAGYAVSRLVVTKTDSGHNTFNFSEILGNGMAAGISNAYYPQAQRTWIKTRQKWTVQVGLDGMFNVFKEFWPDISAVVFRQQH